MPGCCETFHYLGLEGLQLQKRVDHDFPNFICEASCCSPHSPGPVLPDETIAFLLIDPLHYDEKRQIVVPEAFQELTNRDLSVLRCAIATKNEARSVRDELIERGKERKTPQLRQVDEVCIGSVGRIREEFPNVGRLLAVYDTAIEGQPAHASVFTNQLVLDSRELRKKVRAKIHEVMTADRRTFDQFYDGLK